MNQLVPDPIWGTPAVCLSSEDEVQRNRAHRYDSPRCGGKYKLPSFTKYYMGSLEEKGCNRKCLLTSWLLEQRRNEIECPIITRETIEEIKRRSPMSVPDRADEILKYLKLETQEPGRSITCSHSIYIEQLVYDNNSFDEISLTKKHKAYYNLLAYSESSTYNELKYLLKYLKKKDYIELEYNEEPFNKKISCLLTVEGYDRLKKIQQETKIESSTDMDKMQDTTDENRVDNENIRIFISYSWDNENHKQWVKSLAERLRNDGIEAILDQWELAPGDQVPHFMEKNIRESDHVLIICTSSYCEKSNNRRDGVGYEDNVMTAEVCQKENHRKFIPVLAKGSRAEAIPSWLNGKYYLDLSTNEIYERGYLELKRTLLGERPTAPPVRRRSANG
ncbi:MAG: TIR domain-containing protein [Synechococcus sp. SB0678_bin_12]|nr:TIR domain-containing protein [Synechococcus sp. SB0678_bin_12]